MLEIRGLISGVVNEYFKYMVQYIAGTSNSKLPALEEEHNQAVFQSCYSDHFSPSEVILNMGELMGIINV